MFNNQMNPQSDPNQIQTNPYPIPPMGYINKYTDAAISNNAIPKPPPIPPQNTILTMFGEQYNVNDHVITALESQGIRQLYLPNYESKKEMKKLSKSILVNYLDLLLILSQDPSSPKLHEKLDNISTLFYNFHHLINEYRPHQARDTLREIMKSQIESVKRTEDKCHEYYSKSNDFVKNIKSDLSQFYETNDSVESIIDKCPGLSELIGNSEYKKDDVDQLQKPKIEKMPVKRSWTETKQETVLESNDDNDNSIEEDMEPPIKIKREEEDARSISDFQKSMLISASVKDSDLWQNFFNEEDMPM